MRLIDADALISHLNDYALQEAPIYGRHQNDSSYDAIQNCIKAVEECKSVDCVQEIKRQVKNVHQDLSGHEPYKTERWFKIGLDLMYDQVMDIIKHMAAKETGWIPVAERMPEPCKWVMVVIKRHRWIADYENGWVPAEEKTDHPEKLYVSMAKHGKMGGWKYLDIEEDEDMPAAYMADDSVTEDLSRVVEEVIAWMPLPEPYQEE